MVTFLLLQGADHVARWYETPTGAAALVALIGVISAPFVNSWLQARRANKDSTSHLSDTSLTVNAQERKEILDQMRINHERERLFMHTRLHDMSEKTGREVLESKVTEYDARQRAHAFGNECQRLQMQVGKLQLLLAQNSVDPPDFIFKTYPEIMAGVDEKVIKYKDELEDELEERLKREREEHDGV